MDDAERLLLQQSALVSCGDQDLRETLRRIFEPAAPTAIAQEPVMQPPTVSAPPIQPPPLPPALPPALPAPKITRPRRPMRPPEPQDNTQLQLNKMHGLLTQIVATVNTLQTHLVKKETHAIPLSAATAPFSKHTTIHDDTTSSLSSSTTSFPDQMHAARHREHFIKGQFAATAPQVPANKGRILRMSSFSRKPSRLKKAPPPPTDRKKGHTVHENERLWRTMKQR